MSENQPWGSLVQGAGHREGTAPCPGHPAGIPAAVEDASTSSLQPDQPTPGCCWQVPPPQVMLSPCAAHGSGPLKARTQPDKVMSQEGMSLSPHLNHVVQRFVKQVYELAPDVE